MDCFGAAGRWSKLLCGLAWGSLALSSLALSSLTDPQTSDIKSV